MGRFLKQAHQWISMKLLTYITPTHLYRSDTCRHGLGGYSSLDTEWRWKIPHHLLSRDHINLLDFLVSISCIWIDVINTGFYATWLDLTAYLVRNHLSKSVATAKGYIRQTPWSSSPLNLSPIRQRYWHPHLLPHLHR